MHQHRQRRHALRQLALVLLSSPLWAATGWAQETAWPSRPIKLVVPFAAGGATDFLARTFGDALAKRVGQPVIVENKTGASGILGTDAVAKAVADGHTLLFTINGTLLNNLFAYDKLPYNVQNDFVLLSQISKAPTVLLVPPSTPVSNMKEWLAYAKAHKSKLSYGSWGNGSSAHLVGAYISRQTDADMTHVAYKGESAMLQDLLGGQIQMAFASVPSAKPFVDAGRLKAIGLTGKQRSAPLANVPTMFEQGVTDEAYTVVGWQAIAAPSGIPREVAAKITKHVADMAKDPKLQEQISNAGFQTMMNSPLEFKENYARDLPIWKSLTEASGFKPGQ